MQVREGEGEGGREAGRNNQLFPGRKVREVGETGW